MALEAFFSVSIRILQGFLFNRCLTAAYILKEREPFCFKTMLFFCIQFKYLDIGDCFGYKITGKEIVVRYFSWGGGSALSY